MAMQHGTDGILLLLQGSTEVLTDVHYYEILVCDVTFTAASV